MHLVFSGETPELKEISKVTRVIMVVGTYFVECKKKNGITEICFSYLTTVGKVKDSMRSIGLTPLWDDTEVLVCSSALPLPPVHRLIFLLLISPLPLLPFPPHLLFFVPPPLSFLPLSLIFSSPSVCSTFSLLQLLLPPLNLLLSFCHLHLFAPAPAPSSSSS